MHKFAGGVMKNRYGGYRANDSLVLFISNQFSENKERAENNVCKLERIRSKKKKKKSTISR